MMETTKKKLRLNYKQTFLIGFGFLASSLAWAFITHKCHSS